MDINNNSLKEFSDNDVITESHMFRNNGISIKIYLFIYAILAFITIIVYFVSNKQTNTMKRNLENKYALLYESAIDSVSIADADTEIELEKKNQGAFKQAQQQNTFRSYATYVDNFSESVNVKNALERMTAFYSDLEESNTNAIDGNSQLLNEISNLKIEVAKKDSLLELEDVVIKVLGNKGVSDEILNSFLNGTMILKDNFDFPTNFKSINDKDIIQSIDNGELTLQISGDLGGYAPRLKSSDSKVFTQSYFIEMKGSILSKEEAAIGLFWKANEGENILRFLFDNQQSYYINYTDNRGDHHQIKNEVKLPDLLDNETNKLSVIQHDGQVQYYINDTKVFESDSIPLDGDYYGIIALFQCTAKFDYLYVVAGN